MRTISTRHVCLIGAATLALSASALPALADHEPVLPPGVVGQAPPAPTTSPSLSGTPRDGETLTANRGTWASGVNLTHRWIRCDADGVTNCVFIHDVDNSPSYVLSAADTGRTIRLRVRGSQTNATGYREVDSAATAVVEAVAPPIVAHPANTGRAVVGETLTGTSAQFGYGTPPVTEDEYQWERCEAPEFTTCTEIGGATFLRHVVTQADLGTQLRIRERATYGPQRQTVDAYSTNSQTVTLPDDDGEPATPRLLDPFPVIAIGGVVTSDGARLSLLRVRGPTGARVTVNCTGPRCPTPRARRTIGERQRVRIKPFERAVPFGTQLVFRITMPGSIGKYTRLRIRAGRRPVRFDRCLQPGAARPTPCPER